MYHQFSRMTGRLVAATHLQNPLFPVVPLTLQRAEPPAIVYTTSQMSTVTESTATAGKQRLIPGTNIPYPPVPEALRKKQEHFQKDNGLPVHLKGGPADMIMYRLTMLLCLIGLVGVGDLIYTMSFPKKS